MNATSIPIPAKANRLRAKPYAQAVDHQETLSRLAKDPQVPARTVLESIRLWFDLEGLKRDMRLSPIRRNKAARDAELLAANSPAAPVPVKPSTVTPASFQEPEGKPEEAPPPQATKL